MPRYRSRSTPDRGSLPLIFSPIGFAPSGPGPSLSFTFLCNCVKTLSKLGNGHFSHDRLRRGQEKEASHILRFFFRHRGVARITVLVERGRDVRLKKDNSGGNTFLQGLNNKNIKHAANPKERG